MSRSAQSPHARDGDRLESPVLASPLVVLHHWYLHRCQSLGWQVQWVVTAPATTESHNSSGRSSGGSTRRDSSSMIHTATVDDEGLSCPYCLRDAFFAAQEERCDALQAWLRQSGAASNATRDAEVRGQDGQDPPLTVCVGSALPLPPPSPASPAAARARSRLHRYLRKQQAELLVWLSLLGIADGAHALRGCVLLARMARPKQPALAPSPLASAAPLSSPQETPRTRASLPLIRKIPPTGDLARTENHSGTHSSSSSQHHAVAASAPPTLTNTTPIGFFLVPSFESLDKLSVEQTKKLLALPRYIAGPPHSSVSPCLPSAAAVGPETDVWLYQRRAAWTAKRRRRTPACHPAHLGSVVACDVFLICSSTSTSTGSEDSRETTRSFTIWGSLATSATDASASDATRKWKELFFIAHSLEEYYRLGLLFGWVYGWQLSYSSLGPPRSSVPWLRLFNPSAFQAAEALRVGG